MAEDETVNKLTEDGSDALVEYECTPCEHDGYKRRALNFCQNCEEFLCKTCSKYHQHISNNHRLRPAGTVMHAELHGNRRTCPRTTSKPVVAKCHFHPDRDIEMYCGEHDMVYCSYCIAKEHRECSNSEEIEEGIHKPDANKLLQLVAEVDCVYKQLDKVKHGKSIDIQQLTAKKSAFLKEIDSMRKEINEHLDELERKIKTEIDEELNTLQKGISDDIARADELLINTSKMKQDFACNNNDNALFIAEKLAQKLVSDANEFILNARSSINVYQSVELKRNTDLYDSICKNTASLGNVVKCTEEKRTGQRKYAIKSHKRSNVKATTDTCECVIIGMCQLDNGTILIVDRDNNNLKRLDGELNVKDFCGLSSKPYGVCSISSTEVAVRYAESIQFVEVGQTLLPGREIRISQSDFCYGNSLVLSAGNLWTLGEKSLCVYTLSGDLVKTLYTDLQGQEIFQICNPACIGVGRFGTKVYVANGVNRVLVFMNNGDFIHELQDHRLNGTQCVCIAEDDTVFVAGYISKNVVMFDRYGISVGEVITSNDIPSYPWSLCYDRKKCCLLVGYYHTDNVQHFYLSD